jgi:DNA-binding CsgD family transcriptional regulator
VVLDVSTTDDIQERLNRRSPSQRIQQKAIRLCEQAYRQGGLLSNCDLAELLNQNESRIAQLLVAAQKESGRLIPRRATLHDVGTGLTHKRIICWKRYAEGKSAEEVARETYHSLEAVDRYVSQLDRVRYCRCQGMSPEETAYTLNCGLSLVKEYWQLALDLEEAQKENAKKWDPAPREERRRANLGCVQSEGGSPGERAGTGGVRPATK